LTPATWNCPHQRVGSWHGLGNRSSRVTRTKSCWYTRWLLAGHRP